MKLLHITAAIAAMALAAPALAEQPKSPGASEYAPGQKMQDKGSVPGDPGASGYSPGDQMKDKGSVPGDPGASGADSCTSGVPWTAKARSWTSWFSHGETARRRSS